jgi:itaconate CoA-transferase
VDITSLYAAKLTTPEKAVAAIPSSSRISMGMAVAQPPALLKALADRAAAGAVEDLRIYYYETTRIAGDTVLRYELNDRIRPYSMFVTAVDRALVKRGLEDGGRKVLSYVPNNFHEAPRLLIEEIGIDTFLHTVS